MLCKRLHALHRAQQTPVRPIHAARVQVSGDRGEAREREVFEESGEELFGPGDADESDAQRKANAYVGMARTVTTSLGPSSPEWSGPPVEPSKADIDRHNCTHIPFRSWCRFCLMCRRPILSERWTNICSALVRRQPQSRQSDGRDEREAERGESG